MGNSGSRPSLEDIARDPELAATVPVAVVPALLAQIGGIVTVLSGRLAQDSSDRSRSEAGAREDRLLDVKEAAEKLGVSEDFIYRNSGRLPFIVRPSPRRVRCSLKGIERYIRQRQRV